MSAKKGTILLEVPLYGNVRMTSNGLGLPCFVRKLLVVYLPVWRMPHTLWWIQNSIALQSEFQIVTLLFYNINLYLKFVADRDRFFTP